MSCAVSIHCSYTCKFMYILCDYFTILKTVVLHVKYTCDYLPSWNMVVLHVKYTDRYTYVYKHVARL